MHYFCKRLLEDFCDIPCSHSYDMETRYNKLIKISNCIPTDMFSNISIKNSAREAKIQWYEITQSLMFHFKSRNKGLRFALLFTITVQLLEIYNEENREIALLIPQWLDDFIIEVDYCCDNVKFVGIIFVVTAILITIVLKY